MSCPVSGVKQVAAVVMVLGIAGCASEVSGPTRVLEAKAACQERVANWSSSPATVCFDCQSYAKQPECLCTEAQDFGGKCETENTRQQKNADCTVETLACAQNCADNCDCVDACFTTHPACKTDYAALSVCLLDTCAEHCQ